MPGTTPTVDTVRWRAERPKSSCSRSSDSSTGSTFASGSPMPMKTTCDTRAVVTCWARTTCSTISPASRWRSKPACPVAQNVQPIAQPAWDDTQTVARSPVRMSTVSTCAPSPVCQSHLVVNSSSPCASSTGSSASGSATANRLRRSFGSDGQLLERRALRPEPVVQLRDAIARLSEGSHERLDIGPGRAVSRRHRRPAGSTEVA